MIGTTLICTIALVVDADTIRCARGERIRLAGISALERDGSCNSAPDCPTMRHGQAKPIAERLALNRTLKFTVHGRSGKRIVADNRWLRCNLVRSGAAVEWRRYVVAYNLRRCR